MRTKKVCKVYGLYHKGKLRYIGQTIRTLDQRLQRHIKIAKYYKINNRLQTWIKSILNKGEKIEIRLLKDNARWNIDEMEYIAEAKKNGVDLVNCTDGGEGVFNPSYEARKKISLANTGIHRKYLSRYARFNMFTVLEFSYVNKRRSCVYKCKCECGNICFVSREQLIFNSKKSCGCSCRGHKNRAILTQDQVDLIRKKHKPYEYTFAMLAKEFGVSEGTIKDIIRKRTWKD